MTITTEQRLLTSAWMKPAKSIVAAIDDFTAHRTLQTDCRVVLFELPGDCELHVNVTHDHRTATARGWSGPGVTPDGFVHNRRFATTQRRGIVQHIREMVFAATARSAA
jgi:hypothetical protein